MLVFLLVTAKETVIFQAYLLIVLSTMLSKGWKTPWSQIHEKVTIGTPHLSCTNGSDISEALYTYYLFDDLIEFSKTAKFHLSS